MYNFDKQEQIEDDLTEAEISDHYDWPSLRRARVALQYVLEPNDVDTVEHDYLEDEKDEPCFHCDDAATEIFSQLRQNFDRYQRIWEKASHDDHLGLYKEDLIPYFIVEHFVVCADRDCFKKLAHHVKCSNGPDVRVNFLTSLFHILFSHHDVRVE